jgi:hypothetical protein
MENSKIFVSHPYKSFVIEVETSEDGQGCYTWDPMLIIHNYSNEPFAIIGLKIRLGFKNSEQDYDLTFHSSTEITELPFVVQKESIVVYKSKLGTKEYEDEKIDTLTSNAKSYMNNKSLLRAELEASFSDGRRDILPIEFIPDLE